jgi:uncharacterized protein (TIGR02444 family)
MSEAAENRSCWDFVVELYAKPGVSRACLELQDQLGVDVSFLLTILFYARHRSIDFSTEKIASLDRGISAWRDQVLIPLRRLRRNVKALDLLNSPTEEFYRRIKADELLAEQLEVSALEQQLEQMVVERSAAELKRELIERVVKHFADTSPQPDQQTSETVQRAISTLHEWAR